MAEPWTQSLDLRWRPALSFYATSIEILQTFDANKVLRAFRVGDGEISARILSGHELSVKQNGLSLQVIGPDADAEEVWRYVEQAVGMIEPGQMGAVETRFQHVVPLSDVVYADAVAMGRDIFLSPTGGEEVTDWALLVNLPGEPGRAANRGPSVNFGIINNEEARVRLERMVGPMQAAPQPQLGAAQWEQWPFPDVALFADSNWPQNPSAQFPGLPEVHAYLGESRERAGRFVDALYEKMQVTR